MVRADVDGDVQWERRRRHDDPTDEVALLECAAIEAFNPAEARLVLMALQASLACLTTQSDAGAGQRIQERALLETGGELVSVRVARLLLGLHADAQVTAAVLLTPVLARGALSQDELRARYGLEIARLVEEAQRLPPTSAPSENNQHAQEADLLRSTISDLRLLVARVATRIVDLELPSRRSDDELRKLAWEGRELLVPLADRIGLGVMRGRLEDACFKVLEPRTYETIRDAAAGIREADDICLQLLREKVAGVLTNNGITAEIQARTKSLWGLYRKMLKSQLPIERIMDRLGARIVVASVPECYTVLGILHRHFRPIPTTFRDYIGLPKENGYQSLHSCVYPVREISAKPVEFQIRTRAMHAEAEFGAAAHWLYKSREDGKAERSRQRRWLEEVAELHAATDDHALFVQRLERLAYEQSVVIFLRGGEQIRVPERSTAADVVNKVSERPHTIESVLINSEARPLNTLLLDGDTIEWNEEVPQYLQPRASHRLFESLPDGENHKA